MQAQQERHRRDQSHGSEQKRAAYTGEKGRASERAGVVEQVREKT